MIKKHPIFTKLLILLIIIILIFTTINLVWFFGMKNRFNKQTENMELVWNKVASDYRYQKEIDGYICKLSMPFYLSDNGFMSVSTQDYKLKLSSDGVVLNKDEFGIALFIWPQMFSGFEYGVSIYNLSSINQILIDANGSYIPSEDENTELDEYNSQLIDQYKEDIDSLLEVANKVWNLK